jgi:NADPH2:quinone reductase
MVFDEIRREASGTSDLRALAELVAAGELRTEVSLEAGWREPQKAIQALLDRKVAGKAVLSFE